MVSHSRESASDICRGSDLKLHQKLWNVKLRGGSTLISPHLAVRWNSFNTPAALHGLNRLQSTAIAAQAAAKAGEGGGHLGRHRLADGKKKKIDGNPIKDTYEIKWSLWDKKDLESNWIWLVRKTDFEEWVQAPICKTPLLSLLMF